LLLVQQVVEQLVLIFTKQIVYFFIEIDRESDVPAFIIGGLGSEVGPAF
jgi:hypothetical protein